MIKTPPNNACTRRVGVGAFSGSLRGLELVPAKRRCLVPPQAGNASRSAHYLVFKIETRNSMAKLTRGEVEKILHDPNIRHSLTGADLADVDLNHMDLSSVDFRGTNLENANLQWTNLQNVDVRGANLKHADLRHANLLNLVLDESTQIDSKWYLVWDVYNHALPSRRDLQGVDMSGAYLRSAYLFADLRNADLSNCNLTAALLRFADLRNANLSNSDLRGARLTVADLRGANLTNAKLEDADLSGAVFNEDDL